MIVDRMLPRLDGLSGIVKDGTGGPA